MEYTPDNWLIYHIKDDLYKVVGGWSGGYLDGNYWRVNSGITEIEETDDSYIVSGSSGSVYILRKNLESYRHNIAQPTAVLDANGCQLLNMKDILPIFLKKDVDK